MEIESSKRVNSLGVLTIQQLIVAVQAPKITGFSSKELGSEFHLRVKNRLYQYIKRFCLRNRLDESIAIEIFQKTVIKALDKIWEFKFESTISDIKLSNTLFAWLNKIAFNFYLDFLKQRKRTVYVADYFDELECEDYRPDDFDFEENADTDITLQEAWDDLSDREKLIFYFCIEYNCLDNNGHLPDDVIKEICEKLDIEKGNIRVIKLRALKRLRLKFQRNLTQPN